MIRRRFFSFPLFRADPGQFAVQAAPANSLINQNADRTFYRLVAGEP